MKAQEVEWEVLPPEEQAKKSQLEPLFRWLATVMDEFLRVPGTRLRFGLDPLIGLIPGIGDTASAITSAMTLIYAARCGLPKILLARMSLNILINEIVGIVPGIGDAFSFWFKSNSRNYDLLQRHWRAPRKPRTSDWIFVTGILCLLLLVVVAGIAVSFLALQALANLLHHP
jgi:Domain of unknown function (DUF4112)